MNILFLCTHNACRSILCESITRALAGKRVNCASAGSRPAGKVHPATMEALGKHGYGLANLASKSLDDIVEFEADVVITVCDSAAQESCPLWLGKAIKAHWSLVDPTSPLHDQADREALFDSVVGLIERRIAALLKQPFESMRKEQLAAVLAQIGKLT